MSYEQTVPQKLAAEDKYLQIKLESEIHEQGSYSVDSLFESNPMRKDWDRIEDLGPLEVGLDERQGSSLIETMVCCIRQAATGDTPVGSGSAGVVLSERETKQIQEDKIALTN